MSESFRTNFEANGSRWEVDTMFAKQPHDQVMTIHGKFVKILIIDRICRQFFKQVYRVKISQTFYSHDRRE